MADIGRNISILKLAGKGQSAYNAGKRVHGIAGKVWRGAGDVGAGISGRGKDDAVGRGMGQLALLGTGAYGAKKGKERFDMWRYQQGYM